MLSTKASISSPANRVNNFFLKLSRTSLAQLTILLLFIISAYIAFEQPPKPWQEVLEERKTDEKLSSLFTYPIEQNSFLRLPSFHNNLKKVFFLPDGKTGWIIGFNGYIAKTIDGGQRWQKQSIVASAEKDGLFKDAAYIQEITLNDIFFINSTTGWIVGDEDTILSTTDGGKSWKQQNSSTKSSAFYGVYFTDTFHGWTVGYKGLILTTADGGKSWKQQLANPKIGILYDVHFTDASHGWASGSRGTVLSTIDGGKNWKQQFSNSVADLLSINFVDTSHGWAANLGGVVLFTNNGGESWQKKHEINESLTSIFFSDANHGWATGQNGIILSTLDGGKSWQKQSSNVDVELSNIFFSDATHGWAVGKDGTILSTIDGGGNWQKHTHNVDFFLVSVFFSDASHGWAVGKNSIILSTTDGGESWKEQSSNSEDDLVGVYFLDAKHGWVTGDHGTILSTSDGGNNWLKQNSNVELGLGRIRFFDISHGWVPGENGIMLRTIDGGISWEKQIISEGEGLVTAEFVDELHGWAVGERGSILSTRDGGTTWQKQTSNVKTALVTVTFADLLHGWAAGEDGVILATKDGGESWQKQTNDAALYFFDIHFTDTRYGWAVGSDGTILSTVNGGETWKKQLSDWNLLMGVHFWDINHGWVVGDEGAIIYTLDGGKSWQSPIYHRIPAGWFWLETLILLALVFLLRKIPEPTLKQGGDNKSVADEYISDVPTQNLSDDRLDFAKKIDGLSRYLRNENTTPPLTIAINGEWGTGKSSYMRMLESEMQRFGGKTVWFNAWHHQRDEHLQSAFFEAVRSQAVPSFFSRYGFSFRWKLYYGRVKNNPIKTFLWIGILSASLSYLCINKELIGETHADRLIKSIDCVINPPKAKSDAEIVAAAIEKLTTNSSSYKSTTQTVQKNDCENLTGASSNHRLVQLWNMIKTGEIGYAVVLLALIIVPLVKAAYALSVFGVDPSVLKTTLSGVTSRKALSQQTQFRQIFSKEFQEVTSALKPSVLTIFIDDLDRCGESQVMEILESVNYLVESGKCFVVLGIAEETIQGLVGISFERLAGELVKEDQGWNNQQYSTGKEDTERNKRQQRIQFAEHYLEKLINLKIDIPSLNQNMANNLVRSETVKLNHDNKNQKVIQISRWIFLMDVVIDFFKRHWFVCLLPLIIFVGVKFADEMAEKHQASAHFINSDAIKTEREATTHQLQENVIENNVQIKVKESKDNLSFPDKLAPTDANVEVTYKLLISFVALVMMLLACMSMIRRREYNTKDSKAFKEAIEIWMPLMLAKLKTPRNLKRFINRLRFLAMALDAQAFIPPKLPDRKLGTLSRWLLNRKLAELDEERRFNALLPEPILVGLGIIHASNMGTLDQFNYLQLNTENNEFNKLYDAVINQHIAKVELNINGWTKEAIWPPKEVYLANFTHVVGAIH